MTMTSMEISELKRSQRRKMNQYSLDTHNSVSRLSTETMGGQTIQNIHSSRGEFYAAPFSSSSALPSFSSSPCDRAGRRMEGRRMWRRGRRRTEWLVACGLFFFLCLCLHLEGVAGSNVSDELLQQMQFRGDAPGTVEGRGCSLDCSGRKTRPVCGNDGLTYPTKCHVRQARICQGKHGLDVATKGRCKARSRRPSGRPSCFRERREAESSDKSGSAGYVPKCNPDNTYTEVQCYSYKQVDTCWCVTPDGKPIADSYKPSSNGDLDCSRFVKGNKSRRRAVHGGKTRRGVSPDGCGKADKTKLNNNLITLFTQEFARTPHHNQTSDNLGRYERRVIEWKFDELDEDKNGYIKRGEIRSLKKMVKKHVKPKACARKFDTSCDLDGNKKISRKEWSVCLGLDIRKGGGGGGGGKGKGGRPSSPSSGSDLLESLRERGEHVPFALTPSSEEHKESSPELVDREKLGCMAKRQQAVEEDRQNPDGRVFIPECAAPDSDMYSQVQCHSTGYCWCVNESTGKPLPGPATHNETPDCENIKITVFKGCPYPLKRRFLQELLDQLSIEMADAASNASSRFEPDPDHTLEETAVRWKLHVLDKNKNNMLERRETHAFKKDIRKKRSLRKCSRNFLRYCDEDDDGKISMDEWIECTGITEQKNRPTSHIRQGENPLGLYLKSSG